MTNEEAIQRLIDLRKNNSLDINSTIAIETAIEALTHKIIQETIKTLKDKPTGRWIDIQYFKNDDTYYRPKCPFCSIEPKEYSNYCPNCGADMRESEDKE